MYRVSCRRRKERPSERCSLVSLIAFLSKDSPNSDILVHKKSEPSLVVKLKSKQHLDPLLMELLKSVLSMLNESFSQKGWCGKVQK